MNINQIKRMLTMPEYRFVSMLGITEINWDVIPERVVLVHEEEPAILFRGCNRFYDIRRNKFIDTPETYKGRPDFPKHTQYIDDTGYRYFIKHEVNGVEKIHEHNAFNNFWSINNFPPRIHSIKPGVKMYKTIYSFSFDDSKKALWFANHTPGVVAARRQVTRWIIEIISFNSTYERALAETQTYRDGEENGGYILDVKMCVPERNLADMMDLDYVPERFCS